MSYGFSAYKRTSVGTASKEKVLIMLYEAAIKNCRLAIQRMEEKNIADKGMYIGKAQDIINELNNTLDHDVGGDMSKNLEALYTFMIDQTTDANINNDPKPMETVIDLLSTLLEGWKIAIDEVQKQGGIDKVQLDRRNRMKAEKEK